ncbi:MAG: hypothetical protein KAT16_02655 [Candidatus Heimdallarchaeota archaeon]|nr:hypothetical protein [Candidatus Heimdallarchaeota archaeon]
MNVDPFSFNATIVEKDPRIQSQSDFIGYYICSFDTSQGLQVLYSYPSKLKDNQEEVNTLKTHCIWRIEKIPIRIDLKFSEFIYSGFQLHELSSKDVVATIEKPLYGVILKLWKDGPPVPSDALKEFKKDLQELHWDDINLLFRRQSLSSNPSRRREYKKLLPGVLKVEKALQTTWETFRGRISRTKVTLQPKSEETDPNSILPDKGVCAADVFKRIITIRIVRIKESDQIILILINNGELLTDVNITVSKRTDFFSEILWQQSVDEWPMKEDLVLEFHRSSVLTNYLVKISSKNRTIAMKSIEIDS